MFFLTLFFSCSSEFPDEVETPLDVPAKKRFAKYRGLKSFRTSSWDPKVDIWTTDAPIFPFSNFGFFIYVY